MTQLLIEDPGSVSQIYTKNMRLTADPFTGDPALPWHQPVSLQANPHYHAVKDDRFELVLALSIQLRQDQSSCAEIAIDQAGLFVLPSKTPEQIEAQLYGMGCDLLFGYAGVHINEILTQADWPPVYLFHVNFAQCYHRFRQNRIEHPESTQPFFIQVQP